MSEEEKYENWCIENQEKCYEECCMNCTVPVYVVGDGFNEPRETTCGRDFWGCIRTENWFEKYYEDEGK